jgi:hypothetical protein
MGPLQNKNAALVVGTVGLKVAGIYCFFCDFPSQISNFFQS